MRVCGKEINVEGRLIRIAHVDGEKYIFPDDSEVVINGLRKCGTRIDLFTFLQKPSEGSPKFCYPMEWDNLAVLGVSTFEHWWRQQIDGKTRNMVRRSEKKGIVVREVSFDDALVHGIHEIYNECPMRQGRPFPHYGKDVETIREMTATFLETSVFIGAFLDEKLIGFVKLTSNKARSQAGMMHIVAMVRHRDKAPTNALIAESVKACAKRNIPYLVYSNFAYGKKQHDSLTEFKENNGFQRIDLPRYYVPLTPLGQIAFRFGLHHRLVDHLPESLAAKLRDLRSAWYKRRVESGPEAL